MASYYCCLASVFVRRLVYNNLFLIIDLLDLHDHIYI